MNRLVSFLLLVQFSFLSEIDRDLNPAINMLRLVGLDRSEVTPVELAAIKRLFEDQPYVKIANVEVGIPVLKSEEEVKIPSSVPPVSPLQVLSRSQSQSRGLPQGV